MKRFAITVMMLGIILMNPLEVLAQRRPGEPPGQGRNRQELERRVMERLGAVVQEELGLDDGQLASLQEVMQSFRVDRQALSRAQGGLRRSLRDPSLDESSQDQAREFLAEMVRLQEEELDLYRREQGELLTVLNPLQLVQFYRIRDDLGMRIQRLRGGGGPGGTPGRSGGMGESVDWGGFLPRVR
jgi:hypothetical protein